MMIATSPIRVAALERRAGRRPFPFWQTLFAVPSVFIAGIVAMLIVYDISLSATGPKVVDRDMSGGMPDNLASIAAYGCQIILTLVVWRWLSRQSIASIGLKNLSWRAVAIALVAVVVDWVVTFSIVFITHQNGIHVGAQSGWEQVTHDPGHRILMGFVVCVLDPIGEELFCRGLLLNGLQSRMPPAFAVTISSVIFGALHFDATHFASLTASGVIFAAVYRKTGSLYAAMITHGVSNAISVGLICLR